MELCCYFYFWDIIQRNFNYNIGKNYPSFRKDKKQLELKNYENRRDEEVEAGKSPLTIIIPISVILGVIIGVFLWINLMR